MLVELKNKKPNFQKLLSFGFIENDDVYTYSEDLLHGQMKMSVSVARTGTVCTKVIDKANTEEYVLHLVDNASGLFVGQVRAEYDDLLEQIFSVCFDMDVFKSIQAKDIIAYVKDKYGDEPEYLWKKFPDNAVVRRKDNKKWYIALLTVSRRKLGFNSEEKAEIIDFRMKPEDVERFVDFRKYFPGYHMNKKHWVTVCLDETVSIEEIFRRIDDSYSLAVK